MCLLCISSWLVTGWFKPLYHVDLEIRTSSNIHVNWLSSHLAPTANYWPAAPMLIGWFSYFIYLIIDYIGIHDRQSSLTSGDYLVTFFRTIGIGQFLFVRSIRSFDTKWAPRISRKPFDLESPNFMGASTPTLSIAVPDMTSLFTPGRKL